MAVNDAVDANTKLLGVSSCRSVNVLGTDAYNVFVSPVDGSVCADFRNFLEKKQPATPVANGYGILVLL